MGEDNKRKRVTLSNAERKQICEPSNKLGRCSQQHLAVEADKLLSKAVNRVAIRKLLQEKDKWLQCTKEKGLAKR